MIARAVLDERVREWGLRDDVVEKDYVLGWLLWGIGESKSLGDSWIFKGGTCLKKCYVETYRFSEDLDFTVLPNGPIAPGDVLPLIAEVLANVTEACGIDFSVLEPRLRLRPGGGMAEGRIYYRGPRGAPQPARIKLDLSADELLARPPVLRPIAHAFPDELPAPALVRCYGFEELFAEKIRAMGERSRPRDLYDIVNLFRRGDLRLEQELIRSTLERKCGSKGIAVPTHAAISSSPLRSELESEWASMLGYGDTTRLVEPYSLRRSSAGSLLLYGVRVDSREIRCYRVDRIQSVKATMQPFQPAYAIEFGSSESPAAPIYGAVPLGPDLRHPLHDLRQGVPAKEAVHGDAQAQGTGRLSLPGSKRPARHDGIVGVCRPGSPRTLGGGDGRVSRRPFAAAAAKPSPCLDLSVYLCIESRWLSREGQLGWKHDPRSQGDHHRSREPGWSPGVAGRQAQGEVREGRGSAECFAPGRIRPGGARRAR